MKRVIIGTMAIALIGCVPKPPQDEKSAGGYVDIYSTSSVAIAQTEPTNCVEAMPIMSPTTMI